MKKYYKGLLPLSVIILMTLFISLAFAADEKVTVKAVNSAEGICLEWAEAKNAYYYEVYRQEGEKGKKLLLSKVQTASFEDGEAKEGVAYSYTVVPVFSDYSTGKESDSVIAYRLASVYISSAGSKKDGLYVKWKTVKGAKGYRVYRKTAEEGEWLSVGKLTADKNTFLDENISPGQKYTYCVKAFIGEYESGAGNEKELSYMTYPEVKGAGITDEGIRLSWEDTGEAAYYVIFRKPEGEASFRPYALLDGHYTEYEDKDVEAGQLYSYYICGADEAGNFGSVDKEISVSYIKKSVITAAVNTVKGIRLYWSRSEGCQGYGIFRKSGTDKEWKLRGVIYGENKLTAVDSKVNDNEIYTYTVRAFREKTLAAYSDEGVSIRFYSAPEKLSGKGSQKDGVVLKWNKAEADVNYAVYRKQGEGEWQFMCFVKDNTFTDKAVKAKNEYTYAVEVYDGSVLRSGRAEVTVTVK